MERPVPVVIGLFFWASLAGGSCREASETSEEKSSRGFYLPDGNPERGREAFVALRCHSCHEVVGLEKDLPSPVANPATGVKLGGLAMREPSDGELVTSIVNPSKHLFPAGEQERITSGSGSRMSNLNESMSVQALIDIVAFLHQRYETAESKGAKGAKRE